MAGRIRSLKPELREYAPFATLTDGAARLFLMLFTIADDRGRTPASPAFLAGAVFFSRAKPTNVIGQLLAELEGASLVRLYSVKAGQYLEVVGWSDKGHPNYQYIKKPQPSRYPAPESVGDGTDDHTETPPTAVRISDLRSPITDHRKGSRAPSRETEDPPGPELQKQSPDQQTADALLKARQDLRKAKWSELGALRVALAAELGQVARPLPVFDPGLAELAARIQEAGDRAEADIDHVLAVYAAEARAKRTVAWLTGSMFRADKWSLALGMTLDDARRPPRGADVPALRMPEPEDEWPKLGRNALALLGAGSDGGIK